MSQFVLDARTATAHFPGIGRYVRSLAAAMAPLLDQDEQLTLLTDPRQPLNLPGLAAVPAAASPFSLAQQWMIPALLRQLGATVYHSPYYLMPYLPAAPALLTVYDLIPLRHPEHSRPRARLLFRWATRLALRTARHVVAITETTRAGFHVGVPPIAGAHHRHPLSGRSRFSTPGGPGRGRTAGEVSIARALRPVSGQQQAAQEPRRAGAGVGSGYRTWCESLGSCRSGRSDRASW